jgi:VanZ family protein
MAEKFAAQLRAGIKRAAFWLFWPALVVVAYGQLWPNPQEGLPDLGWDKLLHFTAYFGLALLATLAWGRRVSPLTLLLVLIASGGIMEMLQLAVGRDAEWGDMLANTLGACIGAGLAALLLHLARLVDARRGQ